jgi:hypothetical protein
MIGKRFKTIEGQTGTVVYPFAHPSSDGKGIVNPVTVRFDHSRGTFVVAADRLETA